MESGPGAARASEVLSIESKNLCAPRRNRSENRATFRPPRVPRDRDRAAKAECRTAAVRGLEESDCTRVPVNRLNKGERSSAEVSGSSSSQPNKPVHSELCAQHSARHVSS